MNHPAGDVSLALRAPACPQCLESMEALDLEGHYGQRVPTDLCPRCNVVWFDAFESVNLSGMGWVTLLRRMQSAMAGGAPAVHSQLACPRCRAALRPVHNLSRFGSFAMLECEKKHGHLQTFSLLLAERGLVRPISRRDLAALAQERRAPCCMNCGASIEGGASRCSYCASPLVVVDMPRFMTALLARHGEPLPAESAERVEWPCRGCGAPLSPTHASHCEHCTHPVVLPSVLDLRPVLDQAEPMLRAALPRQARPHGEKLRRMRSDYRATTLHGVMRHVRDMFSEGGQGSAVPGWVVLALVAAGAWFLWR